MGCLNWARSCANMAPRPGVSPGMCPELQAPRLHSLRCSRQSRLQVRAGGVGETWPGEWRVPRQSPSFKTTAGRILPTSRVLVQSAPPALFWKKHVQSEVTWHSVGLQRKGR